MKKLLSVVRKDDYYSFYNYVKEGNLEVVRQYIRCGININYQSSNSRETALMCAAKTGQLDVLKELIKAGANVNLESRVGNALNYACEGGFMLIIQELLEHNINVNVKNSLGQSPLIYSLKNKNVKLSHFLLINGANHKNVIWSEIDKEIKKELKEFLENIRLKTKLENNLYDNDYYKHIKL
jgi:ankyrin repeat protein